MSNMLVLTFTISFEKTPTFKLKPAKQYWNFFIPSHSENEPGQKRLPRSKPLPSFPSASNTAMKMHVKMAAIKGVYFLGFKVIHLNAIFGNFTDPVLPKLALGKISLLLNITASLLQ